MKVVLPIAALLAILIAAAVFGGANRAPVPFSQEAPADLQSAAAPAAASVTPRNAAYPVAFDPFTGWGVADLQPGATDPGPEAAVPFVEVDPFDRYGVQAPATVPLVRAVTGPWDWQSFAAARAQYAPRADAMPDASTGPVVTAAWWLAAPLDAK